MDVEKFKTIIGPRAEQIKKVQLYKATGAMRPLAESLLEWYERRLAEEEAKRYDKRN